MKSKFLFLCLCLLFAISYTHAAETGIRYLIAEDVLSRMKPDFYMFKEKSLNIEKILKDCDFQSVDLNDDEIPETIVKVSWYAEGKQGIRKKHNFIRGAHDQGVWQIYSSSTGSVAHIGTLEDGNTWIPLSSKSHGYKDIETKAHESGKESLIDLYQFSNGQYNKVSSILYELHEDGTRTIKKVYK